MATYKQLLFVLLAVSTLCSCQKNAALIENPAYSEVTVTWNYNPWPDKAFTIQLDDVILTDSLIYGMPQFNRTTVRVLGNEISKHLLVKDTELGTTVLDTMVELEGKASLELLALTVDGKPFVGGGGGAQTPADPLSRDSAKYSYIYIDPKLPDSVLLSIHAANDLDWPSYDPEPFVTTVLYRGQFSGYLTFPFKYDISVFYLEFKDAKTGDVIQAIDPNTFTGYSMGIFNGATGGGGNFYSPTDFKFSTVLLKFAGPQDAGDPFRENRFYDLVLTEKRW